MTKRGRPALPDSERRRHEVRVYLSDTDIAWLDELCDGASRSDLLRSLLHEAARCHSGGVTAGTSSGENQG